MKTFFLDQGEFIGGAECFLIDFFNNLTDRELQQVHPTIIGGKSSNYKARLSDKIEIIDFNYPSVKGGSLAKLGHSLRLLSSARSLQKLVKGTKKRQFFSNTPRTHFVMYLAKSILGMSGNWIAMFHDFTIPDFLIKRIAKQANLLVANSMAMRNRLREVIPSKYYNKIRIVENGIDFAHIQNANISQKIEKVLVLGRIDPKKGQLYALEAADLLQERNPNLSFDIVGNAVSTDKQTVDYEKKCHDFVNTRGLQKVRFLNEVDDIFETINQYDLCLFLPTEAETFGRVVTESLAMGKMVLSFDQTGPRDILQNFYYYLGRKGVILNENPFLVEPNNAMSLAEKIGVFADNPSKMQSLCKNARPFVQQYYNLKDTKKRLLGILDE